MHDLQSRPDITQVVVWCHRSLLNQVSYKPCSVRISALALLKMAMHAKSGGNIEVMGVMQGKVLDDTFIVMDAFALPVEGTETRVNAQAEAYEYMVDFLETNKVGGALCGVC